MDKNQFSTYTMADGRLAIDCRWYDTVCQVCNREKTATCCDCCELSCCESCILPDNGNNFLLCKNCEDHEPI